MKKLNIQRDLNSRAAITRNTVAHKMLLRHMSNPLSPNHMAQAKKHRGARITRKAEQNPAKRPGKSGRPKGTYKRYLFEETKLGFFLKYEVPEVFQLIMQSLPAGRHRAPPLPLIRIVCAASKDPSLRKPKFRRYMELYERDGLYCRRATVMTPAKKPFYDEMRRRKLEKFIRRNRKIISAIRRQMTEDASKVDTSSLYPAERLRLPWQNSTTGKT